MKRIIRTIAAAIAAVTAIFCTSMSAYADTIKTVDGISYAYSDKGENKGAYTGWGNGSDGRRYCFIDGVMQKYTWLTVDGKRTYFMDKYGRMVTGDYTVSGKEYTFGADGKVLPDMFGVDMTVHVRQEAVMLAMHTVPARLNGLTYDMVRDTPFIIERKTDRGWEKLTGTSPTGRGTALGDDEYHFDELYINDGYKAENGTYRLVKNYTVNCDKLVGGSKTYTYTYEFEINADTEHFFFDPPDMTVTAGGTTVTASKGTYSWGNAYAGEELESWMEADSIGPLDEYAHHPTLEVPAGSKITIGFTTDAKPIKTEVQCWDTKYIGTYEYGKAVKIPVTDNSFTPKEGSYIYEIHAYFDYTEKDVKRDGNCYYTLLIHNS